MSDDNAINRLAAAINKLGPLERLRADRARVMHALVVAMQAAENWHDILAVADAIIDIEVCHYWPMRKETEYLMSDRPVASTQQPAGSEATEEQKTQEEQP